MDDGDDRIGGKLRTVAPPAGYAHSTYAASLSEWGTPLRLPRADGWLLRRPIPGYNLTDAMGCYPIFACRDWTRLAEDLAELKSDLVSVALVADPFGNHDPELLTETFADVVLPFKEHFVVDLAHSPESFVDSHHQRNARRALAGVEVEIISDHADKTVNEWSELYANLIARHGIRGLPAFSPSSFARQLAVPGTTLLRAVRNGSVVGMNIWYTDRGVGYYHLGAYSDEGYEVRASFALFWRAIEYFATTQLNWLCLGAGAGIEANAMDGLSRFKRGWATGTRRAYFCGKILDRERYNELAATVSTASHYFPVYRLGEFG